MVRYALALADLAGLVTALAGAYFLSSGGTTLDPLLIVLVAWAALSGFYGLYRRDRVGADNATLDEVWPIFHCVTVASWTVFAVIQVISPSSLHGGRVIAFWAVASVAIPAYRSLSRSVLRRQLALKQNAVVVGAGLVGQEIARKIRRSPNYGLDLVGFVDQNPLPLHDEVDRHASAGLDGRARHDLRRTTSTTWCSRSPPTTRPASTSSASATSSASRSTSSRACSRWSGAGPRVYSLEGTPLLGLTPPELGAWHRLAKRTMDVAGAVFGLVVLFTRLPGDRPSRSRMNSTGPVFFRQTRIGRGQQPFTIIKFRTMVRRRRDSARTRSRT